MNLPAVPIRQREPDDKTLSATVDSGLFVFTEYKKIPFSLFRSIFSSGKDPSSTMLGFRFGHIRNRVEASGTEGVTPQYPF
ncbi:MAG: hypothetical protein A2V65_01435 [Deltaproteobacteria bacterium RBG_13_49_15]|nr:MAG: hypothetical protein A2V65_01435 [Deltaproteobacteria bacterium RBG_13_49_15]